MIGNKLFNCDKSDFRAVRRFLISVMHRNLEAENVAYGRIRPDLIQKSRKMYKKRIEGQVSLLKYALERMEIPPRESDVYQRLISYYGVNSNGVSDSDFCFCLRKINYKWHSVFIEERNNLIKEKI